MTKTLFLYSILSGLAFSAASCGQSTSDAAATSSLPEGGGGGDKSLQTTLADPAPAGEVQLKTDVLAEGLDIPWAISFFPEDLILVSERPGSIRAIRGGDLDPSPISGAPDVLASNQGGMFDILPHPDFSTNRTIYLAYAAGTEDANALRVSKATFDGRSISNIETIYEAKPLKDTGHHFGGRLVWGPDGKLFISIGEGSRYKEKALDYSSSFGAIVRLNEDGSIPDDNPDFGEGSLPELFSKGHRNPQGLVYDPIRDILWAHEHGPRGGDEINIIESGENYGWPAASYGIDYNGARITPFTQYEGTKQPFKYWTPSIAPSGMAVYRGDVFSDWDGDLLVGALAGQAFHRVIMDGNREIGEERYLIGNRIRDIRVGPDGAIYVAVESNDDSGGKLLRLTPQ